MELISKLVDKAKITEKVDIIKYKEKTWSFVSELNHKIKNCGIGHLFFENIAYSIIYNIKCLQYNFPI